MAGASKCCIGVSGLCTVVEAPGDLMSLLAAHIQKRYKY